MAYTQHIHDCVEHNDCIVIICLNSDAARVWESHDHKDINPRERANPDHPVTDVRAGE